MTAVRDGSADCPILHVDMDAFYAAVATRDRPDLAGLPVLVGGGDRGVVLSANYLAREHGVRSGIPMSRARRWCPDAVVVRPDYDTFETVSRSVMEVFAAVSPSVQPVSLDEAFIDVGGATRLLGSPAAIAERLRARIHDEQGITCSVGVAASVSVAKVASRRAKPDGVVVVPPDRVTVFLHPLDVDELWGVGDKTRAQLHRLGLVTVGDVAHTPRETLHRALGPALSTWLYDLAWGIDRRQVSQRSAGHFGYGEPEHSMSANETFSRDTDDRAVIVRELLRLSARVAGRMRTAGVAGRTVGLRLRFADFTTITRTRALPEHTDVTQELFRAAVRLYDALGLQRARIRLVGVRIEALRPRAGTDRQLVLGEPERGWSEADRASDQAVRRFGPEAVRPASLLAGRP